MGGALRQRSISKGGGKPSNRDTSIATRQKRKKTNELKETPEEEGEKIERDEDEERGGRLK
eukprot:12433215-Ditylum_brightwellii.AAC.1